MSSNIYAYTCAVKAPSIPTQYYYLHSDSVFVGTISSITNYTTHKFDVKFDVEKTWKGSQHPTITITTQGLVACGYSLVRGEKYLVFASGYPLDYLTWATKPLSSAQDDIALLDSSKFQVQANLNEELFKKLVNARDAISNLMGSNMSKMPISYLFVDDLNFTVNVGIADKKASFPSGAQEYKQKLEEIVGNVPIRVDYADYVSVSPEIIVQHPKLLSSPLKQFKSGIAAKDVTCKEGLHLMIKSEDGSPACIYTKDTVNLFERGWTKQVHYYIDKQPSHEVYSYVQPKVRLPDYFYDGIDKDGIVTINNKTYHQTTFNYTADNLPKGVYVKFQNVTFTFPEGILNTPGGSFVPLDVKFSDGSEEVYGGIVKFPDNVTGYSGISIPAMYGPSIARNTVTVIGSHMMPQAGLTIYHDKFMLLVSK